MQSSLPEQLARHLAFRNPLAQKVLHRLEAWLLRQADSVYVARLGGVYFDDAWRTYVSPPATDPGYQPLRRPYGRGRARSASSPPR